MKKIILFFGFLLLLIAGWYVVGGFKINNFSTNNRPAEKFFVSQSIAGKNKNPSLISYQVNNGKTALMLLKDNAEVKTKGEGVDAYVTSINGKEADPSQKEFWALYVNGKMSDVGAGSYKLRTGDKIEWKIEKY